MLAKLPSDPVYQGCHRSIVIKIEQLIRHRNAERFLRKVREFNECEVIVDAVHDKRVRREDLSRLNRPAMVFGCHPGDDPCLAPAAAHLGRERPRGRVGRAGHEERAR